MESQMRSFRYALKVQEMGADVVTVVGYENGDGIWKTGHGNPGAGSPGRRKP